jgi:hypothetical protein
MSLGSNHVSFLGKLIATLMALVIFASVAASMMSLFNTQDARGWRYTTFADGHTEWESFPQTPGRLGISGQAPAGGTSGGTATSDIITNSEAANAAALLLLAWIEIGVIGLYAKRRWPDLPEQTSDTNTISTLPNSS